MLKWLLDYTKKIDVQLVVVLSAMLVVGLLYFYASILLTTVLACGVGVAILGYILGRIYQYNMSQNDTGLMVQAEQHNMDNNINQRALIDDKMNTTQIMNSFDSNQYIKLQASNKQPDSSTPFIDAFTSVYGFFVPSSNIKKANSIESSNELYDAILNNKVDMDNLNSEVRIITQAMREFAKGSKFLIESIKKEQVGSIRRNSAAVLPTEDTSIQLLAELDQLMNTYPQGPYIGSPLERIRLYDEARKAHHDRVLSVACLLLPELGSSLSELRAMVNIRMNSSAK